MKMNEDGDEYHPTTVVVDAKIEKRAVWNIFLKLNLTCRFTCG
jgi:hypothetical protein